MARPRAALQTLALTGVSLLVSILLAELSVRFLFPEWAPRTGRLAEFWTYDPDFGWAHKPGYSGRFSSFGFDVAVRTNSQGFRGPDRPLKLPAEQRRVVVLGDSFTWGFGVEEDETFVSQMDAGLGDGFDVVNLGVSGYSTDQELLLYRQHGRRYGADVVVLVVATNDFAMNVSPIAYLLYGKPVFRRESGSLQLTNTPVPRTPLLERVLVGTAQQSYLLTGLNRIREQLRVSAALEQPSSVEAAAESRPFPKTEAEHVTVALIEALRRDVEADGARLLVVLVEDIYGGDMFRGELRGLGLDLVSLDEVLTRGEEGMYLPDGLHWTAAGHARVKRAVMPRVRELLAQTSPRESFSESVAQESAQ